MKREKISVTTDVELASLEETELAVALFTSEVAGIKDVFPNIQMVMWSETTELVRKLKLQQARRLLETVAVVLKRSEPRQGVGFIQVKPEDLVADCNLVLPPVVEKDDWTRIMEEFEKELLQELARKFRESGLLKSKLPPAAGPNVPR